MSVPFSESSDSSEFKDDDPPEGNQARDTQGTAVQIPLPTVPEAAVRSLVTPAVSAAVERIAALGTDPNEDTNVGVEDDTTDKDSNASTTSTPGLEVSDLDSHGQLAGKPGLRTQTLADRRAAMLTLNMTNPITELVKNLFDDFRRQMIKDIQEQLPWRKGPTHDRSTTPATESSPSSHPEPSTHNSARNTGTANSQPIRVEGANNLNLCTVP